ncbi:hypothetical protein [Pseudoalteromonas aurantia]|uniref:Uncharacterized protein n=2 Tax=Pseudoalteromonas TaxID=53246 RepID=A0ABY2VUJ3_9GAMM|nr:hypothetical protein [Pseudoalteromonas aurantia]TMO56529.1 hypothetical protein CWC18_19470 [Pseudoalteromonas aurantia]TMO71927.1 hypothetical protein CWC20_16365 [Pseudoalteromonas aurantia]
MSQNQFIRKYKRISKSKWASHDKSTILPLAEVVDDTDDEIELGFTRYIYLHRDEVGKVLGISISKAIFEETDLHFEERYLEGSDMLLLLLTYIDEITEFCDLFTDEFKSIFMLSPEEYFEVAIQVWCEQIENV